MFKKFLNDKKGDIALFFLILVPCFLAVFTSVVCTTRRTSCFETKLQSELDNAVLVASKFYASSNENVEGVQGKFNYNVIGEGMTPNKNDLMNKPTVELSSLYLNNANRSKDQNSYIYRYHQMFERFDGYNSLWETHITMDSDSKGNEVLTVKVRYVIPNFSGSLSVVDFLGSEIKDASNWYNVNPRQWSTIKASFQEKSEGNPRALTDAQWLGLSNGSFTTGIITSSTSSV